MRGKCLCGTIAFEIIGDLPKLYQCHCSLCRKQSGSASNSAMIVEAAKLRWISGRDHVVSYEKPTGFRSNFCSRCGSPVPNPLRTTSYYWVPAGLLDDDAGLEIAAQLFIGSKAPWDTVPSGSFQYETMPELLEFIELLHRH